MSILAKNSQKADILTQVQQKPISNFTAFKIGFLTNVLNPKVTIFLSLFTMILSPDIPLSIVIIISLIMILNTFLWFSLVAFFLTQASVRTIYYRFETLFHRVF